jgi:dihydropteroate synthase
MATVTAAVLCGAHIVRVHDVRAAVETVCVADAIKAATGKRIAESGVQSPEFEV